ncbi:hypothetical protein K504DRAFT_85365 [Pleomassaria siparia CBS 279.74]|uniref:Uncharacterized protein n=1 Tax=Pleomassaria siparia CBS 279.74 TaxID=1314801 RepID=A0A6G1JZ25_9PLEO|nr:hypothetical protein K504DRAFT_85365 [Pleomassaria siparia CBS 279.74]
MPRLTRPRCLKRPSFRSILRVSRASFSAATTPVVLTVHQGWQCHHCAMDNPGKYGSEPVICSRHACWHFWCEECEWIL